MATYREIHGKAIKSLSTDPTAETDAGQIWYNTASNTFKSIVNLEAWISGSNMIAGKTEGGSLPHSPSTAGLAGGGSNPAGWTGSVNTTYSWNGNGWSSESNMNVARDGVRGDGSSTSALFVGGVRPPGATYSNEAESWNGSSWTAETAHPQAISQTSVAGVETAAVVAGGYDSAAAPSTGGRTRETFEYNGSSWTTGNNKPFGASNMGSAGVETASIFFGGFGQPGDGTAPPSPSSNPLNSAEEYDGTNWTTVGSLNTARYGVTGSGVQSDAGAIGGYPAITNFERWDGSSWTNSSTLATGRQTGFAGGSPASTDGAFIGGGQTPSITATTEKFHSSSLAYTAGAWASGGSLNTGRALGGSAITSGSSGIVFGGTNAGTNATEKYDGTTWTTVPGTLNTSRSYLSGFGTATAAVAAGGYDTTGTPQSLVEEYDGSTWSEETNLPASRKSAGNCGTLTAGLVMGGSSAQPYTANIVSTTFEYDGSSWTASGALPEGKGQAASGGTQSASFYAGGVLAPGGRSSKTAIYNGSTWSEGADVVSIGGPSSGGLGATGTTSAGLGTNGDNITNTYDGTAWATSPSYSTARNRGMGGATASDALLVAGYSPSLSPNYRDDTEAFTAETTAVNVKTLTQS